jgi:hypothetical protein
MRTSDVLAESVERKMKLAFLVHVEYHTPKVLQMLKECSIDYYTRWDNVQGKGHGTEPHLGTGSFASMNAVTMIAFEDEAPLGVLADAISAANARIPRAPDRIRLFQLPLERIV